MSNNKLVVETVGDIMLQDVSANQVIEPNKPALVQRTAFITQRLDSKQLVVVQSDVADDYTQADLEKDWKAGKFNKSNKSPVEDKPKPGKSDPKKDDTKVVIQPGSPKHPTESQAQYEARIKAEG